MTESQTSPITLRQGALLAEPRWDVFLGGTCGSSSWRREIAIPLLKSAGLAFYDPQKPPGTWNDENRLSDEAAKAASLVQLFVLTGESRGVATVGEVAFAIGASIPLSLYSQDLVPGAVVGQERLGQIETDDLNRGRLLIRDLARQHGMVMHESIELAVQNAIELARNLRAEHQHIAETLKAIECPGYRFVCERRAGAWFLVIEAEVTDVDTPATRKTMRGRAWILSPDAQADEIVRTAFLAVRQWQEHEARELFRYQNARLFGPHLPVEELVTCAQRSTFTNQDPGL